MSEYKTFLETVSSIPCKVFFHPRNNITDENRVRMICAVKQRGIEGRFPCGGRSPIRATSPRSESLTSFDRENEAVSIPWRLDEIYDRCSPFRLGRWQQHIVFRSFPRFPFLFLLEQIVLWSCLFPFLFPLQIPLYFVFQIRCLETNKQTNVSLCIVILWARS